MQQQPQSSAPPPFEEGTRPDLPGGEQEEQPAQEEIGEDTREQQPERVPYKSFKKKYRKLEHKFNEVLVASDELHVQDVQARRVFNRLVREKTRLLDLLQAMNSTGNGHLADEAKINAKGDDYGDINEGESLLNDVGLHMSELLDQAYEYSSDERAQPPPRNPVSLLEWLKRNQPHVLSEHSLEKPAHPSNGKKKKSDGAKSKKRKPEDDENSQVNKKSKKQQQQSQPQQPQASAYVVPSAPYI
ncbi:hypothetical protein TRICI_003892 [Trichomonascus ciferrii]|uniref:INO80 complex subunit 3 N-terminal domain-containing protein n=1 Tax=Trichomonascus ciferrii TaxID=44093 RepID=A0A642V2M0_9ASCO|nr:hypothetical protein TRICI_003892 [Trichomonascus ciferrii]